MIYNFTIYPTVHIYSKFWTKLQSNRAKRNETQLCRPRRAPNPARPHTAWRPTLLSVWAHTRLPEATRPEAAHLPKATRPEAAHGPSTLGARAHHVSLLARACRPLPVPPAGSRLLHPRVRPVFPLILAASWRGELAYKRSLGARRVHRSPCHSPCPPAGAFAATAESSYPLDSSTTRPSRRIP
jgi:hypothetical protein